jgi:hypothetical protein
LENFRASLMSDFAYLPRAAILRALIVRLRTDVQRVRSIWGDKMSTNVDGKPEVPRFQFRVGTLLVVMTGACLYLAFLPSDLSAETRIVLFVTFVVMTAYSAWLFHRSRQRPWTLPDKTITVKVDAKWLRRVKSPFIFMPVAALTGVSVTFAPFYLLWCGPVSDFGVVEWIAVPLCFLMIYLVPGFYMSLASEVMAQLVKMEMPEGSSDEAR